MVGCLNSIVFVLFLFCLFVCVVGCVWDNVFYVLFLFVCCLLYVLQWEYGLPVVIKHVSDPSLHSVPFMTLHRNKKWCLGQSMDNQIVVYSADSRFRLNTKKHFKGHLNAGYATQVDVSYDGKFVMSGDAQGRLYFWDWQTSRFYGKLKCHQKVCMGCIWHPLAQSLVATCSWDGSIKLWD